jgi:protein-S-isoprenylcysteine O-methyltransferase Ste14
VSRGKLAGYVTLGWPPHAVGYIGLPLLAAYVGDRHGWLERIGWTSVLGAPFLATGSGLIGWAIVSHYRGSPDHAQLVARPNYLATDGAYAVSRNPLYLGGAVMWLGWAIVFASPTIVVLGVALFSFLAFVGVPYEERMLHRRLGADYDAYARNVPRWLAHPRRTGRARERGD